jgi:hypothetical protein
MLNTVGRIIYTTHRGILLIYVEHCGKIYLHTITGKYLLNTVGRFIYTKYWNIFQYFVKINLPTVFNIKYITVFCVNKSSHSIQQSISQYFE